MVKVKFTLDRQTDRQGDSYIPPPPQLCLRGYKNTKTTFNIAQQERTQILTTANTDLSTDLRGMTMT